MIHIDRSEIKKDLPKLSWELEQKIKYGISSIFKVDKQNKFYKEIESNHKNQLINAEYIVYPNFNKDILKIFLDKEGSTLLEYTENVSDFMLLAFKEEEYSKDISINRENNYNEFIQRILPK